MVIGVPVPVRPYRYRTTAGTYLPVCSTGTAGASLHGLVRYPGTRPRTSTHLSGYVLVLDSTVLNLATTVYTDVNLVTEILYR
eukprot:SAG31_NODE_321_length_17733_cov_41.320177_5_plen_83_part_00